MSAFHQCTKIRPDQCKPSGKTLPQADFPFLTNGSRNIPSVPGVLSRGFTREPQRHALAALFPLAILCGLRRRNFKLLAIVAAMGLLLPSISCGSGGGSGGGGGGGGGSNSYTITVSGSIDGASFATLGTVDVTVTH